jgi:hypothetical protein
MTCVRCLGLMIEDQFLDLESPLWADVGNQPAMCELWACLRLRDRAASPRPTGEWCGASQ